MKNPLFPLLTLILAAILLTGCGAGSAKSGIEIRQALVNAGAQGEDSPVYLALRNHDSEPDQLTGVSSEAADAVQLHNSTEIVEVIPVEANKEFVFIPDGYHVMLIGFKQELQWEMKSRSSCTSGIMLPYRSRSQFGRLLITDMASLRGAATSRR